MDVKKLETFRLVAKHGSLRRAAAKCGLTLAALSIQLKKLEAELGVQLFDHYSNKLVLSDRGQVFLKEANRVFEAIERAKASVAAPMDEFVGTVSISIATDIVRLYAPAIAAFILQHPKLHVTIVARPSRDTRTLLLNGEIDIGVGFFGKVPRGITKNRIHETHYDLVIPTRHPLATRKQPTLAEIASYRVILPRRHSASRRMMDTAFASHGIHLTDTIEIGRCQSTMDFVELGLGVGLVHSSCVRPHKKLMTVRMDRYFSPADIALITRSNALLGPAPKALMRALMGSLEGASGR
jgi:DNA-binding transcriptional LysR family regulator